MLIERRSLLSGIIRTLNMPVTEEQINMWERGMLIQKAMPNLSESQREFLMTGITDEEWEEEFGEEKNERYSD